MTGERVIYIQLRAQILQQLNHVLAAILLLVSGVTALQHGEHTAWAVMELGVAVTLIVLFVRSRKQTQPGLQDHVPHHIGWLEVVSGLLVAVEKTSMLREKPHHVSFVIVSYLPALILIFLGLFEAEFRKRFFIRDDGERLSWRFARWRRGEVTWSEVAGASISPRSVIFRMKDGSERKVPTWRLMKTAEVNEWIASRVREREIAVGETAEPDELPAGSATV